MKLFLMLMLLPGAAAAAETETLRRWRVELSLTSEQGKDPASRWVALEDASGAAATASRIVSDTLALELGAGYRESVEDLGLYATLGEARLGASLSWPTELFDLLTPYIGAAALAGWARLSAGGLNADRFVPGLEVRACVRLSGERFFVSGEAAYAWRQERHFRLEAGEGIDNPGVPLGALDLSSYGAHFGVGVSL